MSDEEVPAEDLPQPEQEVPSSDLPQVASSGSEVPPGDMPQDELQDKYGTSSQQALTVAENAAKGFAGPLATAAEQKLSSMGVPGLSNQDILSRQQANPKEAIGSEIAGNIGLMGVMPEYGAAEGAGLLAKVGTKAVDTMIKMGLISSGDEISKSMLGVGDPLPAAAAHVAQSGAIGLLGGALFGGVGEVTSKTLNALEESKLGHRLLSFVGGIGHAAKYPALEELPSESQALKQMTDLPEYLHPGSFKMGQDFYNSMVGKTATRAMKYLVDVAALKSGGMTDVLKAHLMGTVAEKLLNKAIPIASQKIIGPALLKAGASGMGEGLGQVIDHASSIAKGTQAITNGVNALFQSGSNKALEFNHSERERDKLRDFIENGGVDNQVREEAQSQQISGFAEGGQVPAQGNPVANLYPEQNTLISASKGRISNYLNSVRPVKNDLKLPYDTHRDDPQKERQYNQALDLANKPLSILKHVKDGTLVPKHMNAFLAMYPDLHQHLSKKITEQMAHSQLDEKTKPPYKTRQAMSLFLGTSLDSTLTPAGIMAAQGVFMNQKNPPQKSDPALSKMGKSSQTPEQSREDRLTKS